MEGFWKTLLDKISIEIFFMTLCLFGLSLIGLIIFTNQISFIFLIAYCCLSISLSYFLSCFFIKTFKIMANKINKKELSLKISQLSERDVYILTKTLHTGDAGIFIYNKDADQITNLILLKLISPKGEYTKFGYYYVVNKNYRDVISELLLSKRCHK